MLHATLPIDTEPFAFTPEPVEAAPLRRPLARQGVGVHLEGLTKSFGQRRVLDGIGLELKAGEFVAIVGRSGCGKSTLLRTIAGLDAVDSGRVAVGNGVRQGEAPLRMMFQEARLLPWKTVLDNVALGLPNGLHAAAGALAAVGLADRADAWPA